jgi:nitrilase
MKVAAIQMVSTPDVARNLAAARHLLGRARDAGVELAVLPEYFCLLGHQDTDKLAISEAYGQGPLQDFLSQCAADFRLWLVGGTVALKGSEAGKVYNSTLVFNPLGQCVARYDKMHLFCFDNGTERYDESRVLMPGKAPTSFDLPSVDGHTWRVGLSICYDLRFPELYRALAKGGADQTQAPGAGQSRQTTQRAFAAWPGQGQAHRLLLEAKRPRPVWPPPGPLDCLVGTRSQSGKSAGV